MIKKFFEENYSDFAIGQNAKTESRTWQGTGSIIKYKSLLGYNMQISLA